MIRILSTLPFVFMAGAMFAGCADDPSTGRQRPAHTYEGVDMGLPQSGQSRFDERPPASSRDPYSRGQGRY